jgi:hypothetical protein
VIFTCVLNLDTQPVFLTDIINKRANLIKIKPYCLHLGHLLPNYNSTSLKNNA